MNGFDIKKKIENNVKKTIKEFEAREDIRTSFGEPIIGYAHTKNPLFDLFFYKGLSKHPKEIYRPGNTAVVHFVPFAEEIIKTNETDGAPSEEWSRAFTESIWLSMQINGVIRATLDEIGRLSSCCSTPIDWNEQTHHENWSHKLAAYAAGIGELGPAGSFHTKNGFAGHVSAILTDGSYADDFEPFNAEDGERLYRHLMKQCCYKGVEGVACSDEMIAVCPAAAISQDGIDRQKCQDYCKTIDEHIPSPEVCGKCFRFKE